VLISVQQIEYSERPHRLATAAAWAISLVFHAALLACFTGVTWWSGLRTTGGQTEVAIVVDQDSSPIEPGEADLGGFQAASPELDTLQILESVPVEPITDLGASLEPARAEAIIGIDVAAGAGGAAMEGDWSSFVGSGGGSGAGTGSFFGLEARGGKFVYVVDYSGSMTGEKLRAAKNELIRSLNALQRGMRFFIIFYDDRFVRMPAPGLVGATERNKQKYIDWVNGVTGGGGTDPTEAMKLALALKPDATWLLSDGLFSEQACEVIRSANPGARVQIHTIAFYEDAGAPVLMRIAEENRGKYRFVSPADLGLPAPARGPRIRFRR